MHVHDHLTLEALQALTKKQPNAKLFQRHQAVVLALQGRTGSDIASALGCTPRAVQKWVTRYNHDGPGALQEKPRSGRPPRLSGPDLELFRKRVEAGPRPDENRATFHGHDHQRILRDEFGVKLSLQAVYDLLHRLGYTPLMPRPQHKDADEDVQKHFKKIVLDHIQAIAEAHPDQKTRVYFEDEARFGQQGTLTRVWAQKGSRPRGVRQTQYKSLYLLTAVCPATGDALGLICQTLNVEVINVFLQQFSEELPPGVHAVLIWTVRATTPVPSW